MFGLRIVRAARLKFLEDDQRFLAGSRGDWKRARSRLKVNSICSAMS